MAIVAIANQKGGVGKSTLSVHLAVGAARSGKRVILLDADPQGNATSWLMDGETDEGVFRLLINSEKPLRVVRPLARWGLGMVPGNYRTGEALTMLAAVGRLAEIPSRVKPLGQVADLVLMDMPPSRAAGFMELLSAADWVVVPTQLERLSMEGVGLMAQTVAEMHGPRLMGVVPNMARARTREHQAQMEELVAAFGQAVWPPLPMTIAVTEAASYGTVLFDHAPDADVTKVMHAVLRRMLGVLNG